MRIDGLFIVDKPEGFTSLDVVRQVKRRCRAKKAGHVGTLDPFASGVLPVAVNDGTKIVPFLEEEPKEYEGTLVLGEETDTDDPTGEVTDRRPIDGIGVEALTGVFQTFRGKILQIPPMFSAVKVGGQPLYRLARKGIEVERRAREVTVFDLRIEGIELPLVRFRLSCSRGTYVRTLVRDIGRRLGCGAYLLRLRRVRSGPYGLDQAIPFDELRTPGPVSQLRPWLISMEEALPTMAAWVGEARLLEKVRVGRTLTWNDLAPSDLSFLSKGRRVKMISPSDGLAAILEAEVDRDDLKEAHPNTVVFRPLRVFQKKRGFQETEAENVKEENDGIGSGEEEGDYRAIQDP